MESKLLFPVPSLNFRQMIGMLCLGVGNNTVHHIDFCRILFDRVSRVNVANFFCWKKMKYGVKFFGLKFTLLIEILVKLVL